MEKLISIIIVNYNENHYTIDCLKSLKNQTYKNFEILLVDNGSKYNNFLDLKQQIVQFKNNMDIKLIRSDKNLYFGAGNNKAIKIAKGEYICLLNFDTEVMPDLIEKMVDFLENNPLVGMISPKIKIFKHKDFIWNAGGLVDFRTQWIVHNRGYMEYDPDNHLYSEIEPIDYAPGTALFVRKKYLEDIGLMDEIFFMYWEDPEWNFRAKQKGYESYYVPTSIVYHKVAIDRERMSKRQIFNDFFFRRNKQILIWKHGSISDLIIFYVKFYIESILQLIRKLMKKEIYLFRLHLISTWQGFKIGLKRRTNRSCKKILVKNYHFVKKLQNF